MVQFREIKSLHKFASVHASIQSHFNFNIDRHLINRNDFQLNRSAALAEGRQFAA